MIFNINKVSTLKEKAVEARRFIEKDWYINTLFVEGEHWVAYDAKNQSLRRVPKERGQVQRTINNVKRYRNVMTRLIGRDEPTIDIRYTGFDTITEEVRDSADIVNHLLREKWRTNKMENMVIKTIKDGIQYRVAFNEFYWDSNKRDGLGDIAWKNIPVWNVWVDPDGKIDLSTGEFTGDFIIKSVSTSKEYIENNPKYNGVDISLLQKGKKDNEVYEDLRNILYNATNSENDDMVVIDVWYIKNTSYETIEDDKGNKFKKEVVKYEIKEMVGNTVIYEEDCDLNEYPIKMFVIEVDDRVWARPPLSDQIDLNKTIDQIYSSMEEYARTMVHGRILKHAKTKLGIISNRSGQIVSYDGARPPSEMKMSGVDGSLFNLIDKAESMQQNMANVSDGTLGTGNSSSGLELGLRKASDLENASEPATCLSLYLSGIAKTLLKLYVKHLSTSMPITIGKNGEEKIKNVVSKNSEFKKSGVSTIMEFDDIEIKIVPKSAYSDLAEEQSVMRLAEIGAIDRETVVQTFMKGNTRDILRRVRKAELEAQGMDGELLDAQEQANAENEELMKGKKPKSEMNFKSVEAKKASLMINADFLRGLIESKASDTIINNTTKLIKEKAKRFGIPMTGL